MKGKKVFSSIVLALTLLISLYFVVFGVVTLLSQMGMSVSLEGIGKLYESYAITLLGFAMFCAVNLKIPDSSNLFGYIVKYTVPILYLVMFILGLILFIKVLKNRTCKKTAIFTLVFSILIFVVDAFYFLGTFIYSSGSSSGAGDAIINQYTILVALILAILCMFVGIFLINYMADEGMQSVHANNGAQMQQQNPNGERSFVNSFENQNNMNAQNGAGAQPNAQNGQVNPTVAGAAMWQTMNNAQNPATPTTPSVQTPEANPWGTQPAENAWSAQPTDNSWSAQPAGNTWGTSTPSSTPTSETPASTSSFSADVQPNPYSSGFSQPNQTSFDQSQSNFGQTDSSFGAQAPSSLGQPETGSDTQPSSTFDTPAGGSTYGTSTFANSDAAAASTFSSDAPANSFGAGVSASPSSSEYISSNEVVDANGNPAGTNQDGGDNGGTQF